MSVEAMSAVLGYTLGKGNGTRKFVLLGYANHADKYGRNARPSKGTLAGYCECDNRTVQRHILWLVDHGYLREGDQQQVAHLHPNKRPIVYDVAMNEDQIEQWAREAPHRTGIRSRSVEAGKKGGPAAAEQRWGDRLSPQHIGDVATGDPTSRGDKLSPQLGGDNSYSLGETARTLGGDTGVSQTVLEPSTEPSSSSPRTSSAASDQAESGGAGGDARQRSKTDHELAVLPPDLRYHPSVNLRSIREAVRRCQDSGWTMAQLQGQLDGVALADRPGAVALVRLRDLYEVQPPSVSSSRPSWCGSCNRDTRRVEDDQSGHDRGPCPTCHPSSTRPVEAHIVEGATV